MKKAFTFLTLLLMVFVASANSSLLNNKVDLNDVNWTSHYVSLQESSELEVVSFSNAPMEQMEFGENTPMMAGLFSLVIPGLGQAMVNDDMKRGVMFFAGAVGCYVGGAIISGISWKTNVDNIVGGLIQLAGAVIHLYSAYDAYNVAKNGAVSIIDNDNYKVDLNVAPSVTYNHINNSMPVGLALNFNINSK